MTALRFSARFLALFGILFALLATSWASPILEPRTFYHNQNVFPCTRPLIRKEWRKLTTFEKQSYIKAVQCISRKPAYTSKFKAVVHKFDLFTSVHISQTNDIHFVGHFLPWHRYFLAEYEKALRWDCGYTGAQPYWDWVLDAESKLPMDKFPIFDNKTGFGGNGPFVAIDPSENFFGLNDRTGGGCVPEGPFSEKSGFRTNTGPGDNVQNRNPRCLMRDFCPETFRHLVRRSVVDELMAQKNFEQFAWRMEGLPTFDLPQVHGGGHFGVGGVKGQMGDAFGSPGDPVFYLHHANLDRIWSNWQKRNPARYFDIGGPIKAFDYTNQQAGNVTLDFKVTLDPISGPVPLASLMYTKGPFLCYDYA